MIIVVQSCNPSIWKLYLVGFSRLKAGCVGWKCHESKVGLHWIENRFIRLIFFVRVDILFSRGRKLENIWLKKLFLVRWPLYISKLKRLFFSLLWYQRPWRHYLISRTSEAMARVAAGSGRGCTVTTSQGGRESCGRWQRWGRREGMWGRGGVVPAMRASCSNTFCTN